jgi:hypothetical protein
MVIWDVQVIFEGNALTIVNAICQDVPCWRSYGQLIEDTCTLLQGFCQDIPCWRSYGQLIEDTCTLL